MFHDASIILSKHILNQMFETFFDKSKNLRMPDFFLYPGPHFIVLYAFVKSDKILGSSPISLLYHRITFYIKCSKSFFFFF